MVVVAVGKESNFVALKEAVAAVNNTVTGEVVVAGLLLAQQMLQASTPLTSTCHALSRVAARDREADDGPGFQIGYITVPYVAKLKPECTLSLDSEPPLHVSWRACCFRPAIPL